MKIIIKEQYKSIKSQDEFELPDFCVLTGKNGSGKSHLLEALSNNTLSKIEQEGQELKNILYIGFNQLSLHSEDSWHPERITKKIQDAWSSFAISRHRFMNGTYISNDQILAHIHDSVHKEFAKKVFRDTHKSPSEISESDFFDSFDVSFMDVNKNLFSTQIGLIFKDYHIKLDENDYNEFCQKNGRPVSRPVLNTEEFQNKYGSPPWDYLNQIFDEVNIPYIANNPLKDRKETPFTFKLIDKDKGFEIPTHSLSTGEKILMSLALAIYITKSDYDKPELLLLDEPDAALHPSMTQKMVQIIKHHIVYKSKIPTIITTHSPTTVIASDGIAIYQMTRGNSIPEKVSTQKAIELLSGEIPFLKISNDKRRQVFVESKYDVQYYEQLLNILIRVEKIDSEPIFLTARSSNGSNCTDVIELVSNLYKNGNDQVYGIIDWDKKNKSNERIIVLGENERYSIENYLLDPLLIGLLLIRERKINITDFDISSFCTYSEANKMTSVDAQNIIDKVLSDLNLNYGNKVKYSLYNGWDLEISEEFNLYQGHDLEKLYKSKYPSLKSYHKENSLKIDIIDKIINDYPQYSPSKIFGTIKKVK